MGASHQKIGEVGGSIPAMIYRFKLAADVITMRRDALNMLGEDRFRYQCGMKCLSL